ncbi:MAG: sugar phosphate isomerase/epimerase family protein [Granulicella sp.]
MMSKLQQTGMSRRSLLIGAATAGVLQAFSSEPSRAAISVVPQAPEADRKLPISIFSKHLQWLGVSEAARVAKDMGFDALDLTVRANGHVLPENVTVDLPKAVDAIRKAGLEITMITTDIMPNNLAEAETILKSAARVGIHHYRWGFLKYDAKKSIAIQLEEMRPKMRALAELNERTGVCGMYHTHSGPGMVGACIWDLWLMFRDLNPKWMGINYDIGHATVEGGYGGWMETSRLTKNYMRGIALKDFLWQRNAKGTTHADPYDKSLGVAGTYVPHWCPINDGMVRFDGFFEIIKADGFDGPVQLHFEYPLGGAENGKKSLTLPREHVIDAMKADLMAVRLHMAKQGLV